MKRKIYSILIGFTLATSCLSFNVFAENNENVIYGDADFDNTITANDSSCVFQKVLNLEFKMPIEDKVNQYMKYIDVDGDEVLAAADSSAILQKTLDSNFKFVIENTQSEESTLLSESSGGVQKKMSSYFSNWASPVTSYMYVNNDNTFCVADVSNNIIRIDTYNIGDYKLINSKTVNMELPIFGGIYSGNDYNFIVFGQENASESNEIVTFKTVKYSKQWEKISEVDYSNNNTIVPFSAGSLRMAEHNGYLYVRSSHKMYKSSDGYNHQSNITYSVDINNMNIVDQYSTVMNVDYGYVSHSFDQYIAVDNGKLITLDLGDAYPRSVVLVKYNNSLNNGKFISNGNCSSVDMFKISGDVGNNYTGVTIGGFEISDKNYISVISSIDQNKKSDFRDVIMLLCDKNSSSAKEINITNYANSGKTASTPYIAKTSDKNYIILWEEFSNSVDNGVKYVKVNENGELLTEIKSFENANLSSDCQPIYINNEIVWYINVESGRMFYKIKL